MSAGDITAEESEEVGMAVGLSCAFQEGRTSVPGPHSYCTPAGSGSLLFFRIVLKCVTVRVYSCWLRLRDGSVPTGVSAFQRVRFPVLIVRFYPFFVMAMPR